MLFRYYLAAISPEIALGEEVNMSDLSTVKFEKWLFQDEHLVGTVL